MLAIKLLQEREEPSSDIDKEIAKVVGDSSILAYTSSIDLAMSIVPHHIMITVEHHINKNDEKEYAVGVRPFVGVHKNLAMVICIAALSGRMSAL